MDSEENKIIAVKGFNKDWTCRGFQFEVGKTYEHAGEVKACASGFHSVDYPLDVFGYYAPSCSVYALVEVGGAISRHDQDTKIASAKITITAELNLSDLILRAVKWVFDRALPAEGAAQASGTRGAAQASGYQGAAQASGTRGAAQASGDQGAAQASGTRGAAQASGTRGAAQASGDQGAAQASGTRGAAQASGYQGAAQASGYQGAAQASGYQGAAQASGTRGAAQASGDQGAAQASGTRGAAQASGYQGAAQASGTRGAAQASGKHGVASGLGYESKARAAATCAIVLVNRNSDGEIQHVFASKVGENGIEADVWYMLDDQGHPVNVD